MNVGKKSILSKKEQRILNKILQTRINCRWYLRESKGREFCAHPHHTRYVSNFATWGLCKGVCEDFETK